MDSSPVSRVTESARLVHTPLIPTSWSDLLASYPNERLAQFFLKGIKDGFPVGYNDHKAKGLRCSRKKLGWGNTAPRSGR